MNIVFAGTAAFAVPSLRSLVAAGHAVGLVITQPDRPGHRMKVTAPPVKQAALELGLEVYQPERIREAAAVERLRGIAPDLLVVVAYGQLIPPAVLAIAKSGAVNVHASLLPRHRGAAPIARAILAGDETTGVTIMKMDDQLDHGPVLAARSTPIGRREDSVELTSRLAQMGAELLVETLASLDHIEPMPQAEDGVTLAPRLTKAEGEIDWSLAPEEIDRRVRALQPWPGVTLPTKRGRIKVLSGHLEGGRYVLDVVQVPGRRPAPAGQVLGDA